MDIRKARSVVPSLFTVGNMALGFYSIMSSIERNWVAAAVAVFIAHVMDILDGRVARFMGMTSKFGGEFDSFADWISFGIAPAVMVYLMTLREAGKLGFLLAFLYVLCGALRLARFNLKAAEPDETGGTRFSGLPIPGAGGFIAVVVMLIGYAEEGHQGRTMNLIYHQIPMLMKAIPVIVFGLSLLMISRVQYMNFKKTHFFRPQSTVTFMITVFVAFMIYAYPQNTIFILYVSYILWGLINTALRAYRLRRHA